MEYPSTTEQYEALLESIPDPLVLVDGETRTVVDANVTAERLLGMAHEALVDAGYATLFAESDRETAGETVDRALDHDVGDAVETDLTLTRTDGEDVPVTVAVTPVDAGERLVLARMTEIAARRERERHLRRYTTYLGQYHTITTDADASFEGKLGELLDLVCTHFDFDVALLASVEGTQCEVVQAYAPGLPLFPGDTLDGSGTACQRAAGSEEPVRVADVTSTDLGASFLVDQFGLETRSFVGLPVRVDGHPYGALCLYDRAVRQEALSDAELTLVEFVGEWFSYELSRRQRERELERQNERLDEFASIVSHDLRNPLSAAKGYLALAMEESDLEDLEKADRALDRMDELLEEVLTLARNGETVGETEPVDLATLAERSWTTVESAGATLELADDLGTVAADRGRLGELLENLFRNSVEHGSTSSRPEADDTVEHAGPDVTVRVGPLDQGFYVEDDGPGIEGDHERVFEYGYTTSDDGTGFGLAIVRQIAEAHGWDVTLAGSEAGARFEFTTTTV